MDLTPSHPGPSEDEPLGEPPTQTAGAGPTAHAAHAGDTGDTADAQPGPQAEPLQLDGSTASRSAKEIGGRKFRVGAEDQYVPFRRRTRRRRRMIAAGAAGLVLVGAGAYGVGTLIGSPSQASTAGSCPARANAAAAAAARTVTGQLPTAAQIKLNVYNSTDRHGLAAAAAAVLKQRGFTIDKVTNDPLKANLSTAAEVRGASASTAAMQVVAAEVIGSQLHTDARTDNTVDLVLGTAFTALASPDQVSAALKQVQQAQQPQAAPAKAAGKCS
jgi:hypothetical protein